VYTFLGAFIWSAALAYGGFLLGSNWEKIRNIVRPFEIPIVIAVVLLMVAFIWRRLRELRNQKTGTD
jgi:membrane protein DedA with SNARE-associated domain